MDECNVQTVGSGTLITLTALSSIRAALMLVPHCVRSVRFDSSLSRNKWWFVHRRMALLHYAFLVPFFELFVTWGPTLLGEATISPFAAEVQLVWLSVLVATAVILLTACGVRTGYRMMIYVGQILELPCMVAFLCERATNDSFGGGETSVIGAIVVCSVIEVFTVPDFFHNYFPNRQSDTAAFSRDYDGSGNGVPMNSAQKRSLSGSAVAAGGELSDDGELHASHDLAENATTRLLRDLFALIETAKPSTMTIIEMRVLIERCKEKLLRVAQAQQPMVEPHLSAASPPPVSSASSTNRTNYSPIEYGVLPAFSGGLATQSMAAYAVGGNNGGQTIPFGVGPRYKRHSDTYQPFTPEC